MLSHLLMLMQKGKYRFLRFNITASATIYAVTRELYWVYGGVDYPTAAMTSNSTPSPMVADASNSPTTAWQSFDHDTATGWASDGTSLPQWVQIDLGAGNLITPTGIGVVPGGTNYPTAFTCLGSATGAFAGEEITLYSASGLTTGWTSDVRRDFTF